MDLTPAKKALERIDHLISIEVGRSGAYGQKRLHFDLDGDADGSVSLPGALADFFEAAPQFVRELVAEVERLKGALRDVDHEARELVRICGIEGPSSSCVLELAQTAREALNT